MNRLAVSAFFVVAVAAVGCVTVDPFQAHQDLARKSAAEDLGCQDPLSTTVVDQNDRGAGKDRVRDAKVLVEGCGQKATYGIQCVSDGSDGCTKTTQELPSTTVTPVAPEPVVQPGAVPNP